MSEEKTYNQIRNEFYEKYRTQIVPRVLSFEKERKTKLKITIFWGAILTLIALFILNHAYANINISDDSYIAGMEFSLIIFGTAYVIWYVIKQYIKKSFESKIKEKIMPIFCSCFDNLTWSEVSYNDGIIFKESGIINYAPSAIYDDIFTGSHQDVGIEIVEAEFGTNCSYYKTVFKGAIVRLDMNKDFSSHTIITQDSMYSSDIIEGCSYFILEDRNLGDKYLKHTVLENKNFEDKYNVYTNNEIETKELITPTFIEYLNEVQTAFKADTLRCAFYKNNLLISLETNKDLFSLCSLSKPIDDEKQYFQMFEEILSIIKLIDHFKLDQKIGL